MAGTGGIAAAVDTLWHLKRKLDREATLEIVGRESDDTTFALRFDQDPLGWSVLGEDALLLLNPDRRQVLELLTEEGALTPTQISAEIGKTRPATRMLLMRMKSGRAGNKAGLKVHPLSLYELQSYRERKRIENPMAQLDTPARVTELGKRTLVTGVTSVTRVTTTATSLFFKSCGLAKSGDDPMRKVT